MRLRHVALANTHAAGGGAHRTFVSTLLALIGNLWGLPRETALRKGPAFFDGNIWNSMKTLLIACEVLRPELEVLASDMRNPPPMNFLEQRLHDYPEKLRSAFQGLVDAFEQENDGPLAVLCGYGLCGRGLSGVHASRATLVFPKLHDCIPLLLGLDQKGANASSREGATYWISPGWLKYFLVPFHLESYRRFSVYEKKFGAAKAARMMKAENALLDNYKNACHIRWPEMGDAYVDEARKVAEATLLPYSEIWGSSAYLAELLHGGQSGERFLHLVPGQTIDMDVEGTICAVACPA